MNIPFTLMLAVVQLTTLWQYNYVKTNTVRYLWH